MPSNKREVKNSIEKREEVPPRKYINHSSFLFVYFLNFILNFQKINHTKYNEITNVTVEKKGNISQIIYYNVFRIAN